MPDPIVVLSRGRNEAGIAVNLDTWRVSGDLA